MATTNMYWNVNDNSQFNLDGVAREQKKGALKKPTENGNQRRESTQQKNMLLI